MANTTAKVPGTTNAGIAGFFKDESKAETAIDQLKAAGFSENEIGVATPHEEDKVGNFWDRLTNRFGKQEHTEQASDLQESLRDFGIPEQQAGYFNSELDKGGVLVTVQAGPAKASTALSILQRNGADIGTAATEWRNTRAGAQGIRTMRLLGEILRVHKDRVSRGEVRLRKEVVTETQNIEVPTTREELVIERTPGSGQEAAGMQVGSGDKEIRVPLSEEQVRVEKKPVINEEIQVGKRQVQDRKRVSDQVRHEELRTETQGDVDSKELDKSRKDERAA